MVNGEYVCVCVYEGCAKKNEREKKWNIIYSTDKRVGRTGG